MVSLGAITGGLGSSATVVSPDGSMVFGQADVGNLLAFVWTQDGGMRLLKDYLEIELGIPLPPGAFPAGVRDISLDGRTIVGVDFSFGGYVADLGCPDDDDDGLCNDWETSGVDINNDGLVDLPIHLWGATPDHKDLFVEIDAMSGFSQPQAVGDMVDAFAALRAVLEDGCQVDLNGNAVVDGPDLADLLAQWGGSGSADFDASGLVDGVDLADLLAAWGPCP